MKKSTITFTLLFFMLNINYAQDLQNPKTSNFSLTGDVSSWVLIGGSTINLEAKIHRSESGMLAFYGRAGYTSGYLIPLFSDRTSFRGGLIALTLLTGPGNHHFEASLGTYILSESNTTPGTGIFFSGESKINTFVPLVNLGYRYQKPEGGFIFKVHAGVLGLGLGIGIAF